MAFCSTCGNSVRGEARFCAVCGHPNATSAGSGKVAGPGESAPFAPGESSDPSVPTGRWNVGVVVALLGVLALGVGVVVGLVLTSGDSESAVAVTEPDGDPDVTVGTPERAPATSIPGTNLYEGPTFVAQVPIELGLASSGPESDGRRYVLEFSTPGDDIGLVVDTTPGYDGAAVEGCRSVRDSSDLSLDSLLQDCAVTYIGDREIAVLQWIDGADTVTDAFFLDSGNGYAVLARTDSDPARAEQLVYQVVEGVRSTIPG